MDVLAVDNIKKSFRREISLARKEVLHGLSIYVNSGEILGFLGPNGAGKTTTIKIILGLIKPDSGEVKIFDHPVGDRRAMSRIGYLPELPYFYPHLSLEEFLTFCGQMSGMERRVLRHRVDEVIRLVELADHRYRRLKDFSKGMIQRAGLAQAVLHDPDLLILDEPFSGLDPMGRIQVRDILLGLKDRRKTIFFSSHILPDMEALCDRACIINEGTVVRWASLDELTRMGEGKIEVATRYCGADVLEDLTDYVESTDSLGDESFLVVKEQKYLRTVLMHLLNNGAEVLRVENRHPSLEDVFISEVSGVRKGRDGDGMKQPDRTLLQEG